MFLEILRQVGRLVGWQAAGLAGSWFLAPGGWASWERASGRLARGSWLAPGWLEGNLSKKTETHVFYR